MQVIDMSITELKEYENNPRNNDKAVAAVAESIKHFGFKVPVIIDNNNIIIAGHTRLKAAKSLGLNKVPCIIANDLTEDQIKAFRLADNKTAELAEWDFKKLEEELANININMFDFGFNEDDFKIDPEEAQEDGYDVEAAAEEIDEPITQLGDIWQLGRHRLICGDSTDKETILKLMDGAKADMVFTDPPYGMNLDTDFSSMVGMGQGNKYKAVKGDNEDFSPSLIYTVFNNFNYCNEIFLWGADYFAELLPNRNNGSWIVWDKQNNGEGCNDEYDKMFGSNFELCWSKAKHKRALARVLWKGFFGMQNEDTKKRVHPTQKPLELAKWFLNKFSKENDIIVDLYGGSGSTLIACEQLNRVCYMAEYDTKYCDVIIQRWEALTGQQATKLNASLCTQ